MKVRYLGKCLLIDSREGKKILVIGDLHVGYEEALEKSGAFVGRGLFGEMIKEFDEVFGRIGKAEEVVLLGDLKHGIGELGAQERTELMRVFDYLAEKCKKIIVIRGNHDNYLLNITARKRIEVKDYYLMEEIAFLHGDRDFSEIHDSKIKCWIMGHLHPAIKLSEASGAKEERYKCFLRGEFKGKKIIIVPSFSSFSGGMDVRGGEIKSPWKFNFKEFEIKIVAENLEVLDFGKMKNLKME